VVLFHIVFQELPVLLLFVDWRPRSTEREITLGR
jgi:hypothetical protein